MHAPRTIVRKERVHATGLVPGDIADPAQEDTVSANLRLLSSQDLEVDWAPLTGESTPVAKNADDKLKEHAVVNARTMTAFADRTVINGNARDIVCRIGKDTQVGQIAESLAHVQGVAEAVLPTCADIDRDAHLAGLALEREGEGNCSQDQPLSRPVRLSKFSTQKEKQP